MKNLILGTEPNGKFLYQSDNLTKLSDQILLKSYCEINFIHPSTKDCYRNSSGINFAITHISICVHRCWCGGSSTIGDQDKGETVIYQNIWIKYYQMS